MVPLPVAPGVITICGGHGPIYFVESAEPDGFEDRSLRRGIAGYCYDELVSPFAVEIALLASEVLPACAALESNTFLYSTAEVLTACALFTGDRLAAAQVYNRMGLLIDGDLRPPPADDLALLFGDAQIVRPGTDPGPHPATAPADAWLQALGQDRRARFIVERVHGENARRVVADGLLRRRLERDEGEQGVNEESAVQLVWTSEVGGDFEITGMTMGAPVQRPDLCDSSSRRKRTLDC